MIKIGILGDIGSGKSYIAKNFGYPVFNADKEVGKLYKRNKRIFIKLKKVLPKFIYSFPINKNEIIKAIFANKINLKKITKIIHSEIRKEMSKFLKKHVNKKIVILDIPLLLENKINKKNDVLIFVESKKSETLRRLKKRKNFNMKILNNFQKIQLSLDLKRKKSQFIIKNNFKKNSVKIKVKEIIENLL